MCACMCMCGCVKRERERDSEGLETVTRTKRSRNKSVCPLLTHKCIECGCTLFLGLFMSSTGPKKGNVRLVVVIVVVVVVVVALQGCFNEALKACAVGGGRWERAASFLEEMRYAGVTPDRSSYSAALDACERCGHACSSTRYLLTVNCFTLIASAGGGGRGGLRGGG